MQPGSGMKFATLHRVSPAGLTEKMSCEERQEGERGKASRPVEEPSSRGGGGGGRLSRVWEEQGEGWCVASRGWKENTLRSFIQGLGDHCN